MRYENPYDARLLREAYARNTRRPHTETFAEKVVSLIIQTTRCYPKNNVLSKIRRARYRRRREMQKYDTKKY